MMMKNQKILKCDKCEKQFISNPKLRRHIDGVHERQKNVQCETCDKQFFDKSHLKRHKQYVHEGITKPDYL